MKVPCTLQFTAEEKYIKVLKKISVTLIKHANINTKNKLLLFPFFYPSI